MAFYLSNRPPPHDSIEEARAEAEQSIIRRFERHLLRCGDLYQAIRLTCRQSCYSAGYQRRVIMQHVREDDELREEFGVRR